MKKCTKCHQEKSLDHFSFRNDTKKYRGQCRKCHKGYYKPRAELIREVKELFDSDFKVCGCCKETYPISNFSKDKYTLTGLTSKCKKCTKAKSKCSAPRQKMLTAMNRYKITEEKYYELMDISSCEICGDDVEGKQCIDHNHSTGAVRGVLCWKCNIGIGQFRENIESLENAKKYLIRHK